MSNTEKRPDEIIADTMKELYERLEKKETELEKDIKELNDEELKDTDFDDIELEIVEFDDDEEPETKEEPETEEEFDDEEDSEADENEIYKKEHKSLGKKILKGFGFFFGILLVVYAGFAVFFNSHFLFQTTINGKDYALKSVQAVEDDMKLQVQDYSLTLEESDGDSEVIVGEDISLEYVPTEELNELVSSQNNLLWITSLWEKPELATKVTVQYSDTELSEVIKNLACMDPDNQEKSVSAKPEFKETQFEITEEVIGTQIEEDIFNEAVRSAIESFEDTLVLAEAQCYRLPKYVSTSEEVIEACEKMNSYLGAEITYDLHPDKVVVDASVISEWITVSKKMKVKFSEDKMREFLSDLGKKYDTRGKERTFKAADGNTVKVSGGGFGWLINEKEEFVQLKKDIKKGKKITREPVYYAYGKAVEHTETDWGDTYAEVDLTDQRMYFIKNGNVVLESPVVTGNPNRGNATPQGVYSLTYKTRNAVLRGERDENGEPEYETPVAYWMPFNGGIGFHDATWQSSFGGSRYRTNGSHGCINMPLNKAKELYNLIPDKCPVICHY